MKTPILAMLPCAFALIVLRSEANADAEKPPEQAPGGGSFNVRAYGAKGDSKTDDTKAIQAAIKAADELTQDTFRRTNYLPNDNSGHTGGVGGTVYFPPGIYRTTDTIRLKPYIKYVGNNYRGSVIRLESEKPNTPVLQGDDARWIHVQDLGIETVVEAKPGQNGISLKRLGTFGVKFTFERLAFSHTYDAISIEGDTTGSSMRDIYIRSAGRHGFRSFQGSLAMVTFESIYIAGSGSHGFVIEGSAGSCLFNTIATEAPGGDGMRLVGVDRSAFNAIYLGDSIAKNGLYLEYCSNNSFNGLFYDGGKTAESAIVLNGSYNNWFRAATMVGPINRYVIEWKDTITGIGKDKLNPKYLRPNVFDGIATTAGGILGYCNNSTHVALKNVQSKQGYLDFDVCQEPFFKSDENIDKWSWLSRDTVKEDLKGSVAYGAPDPNERWSFLRDFPGVPAYSFLSRGQNMIGVLPVHETLGKDLITGDGSLFEEGIGSWRQATPGCFERLTDPTDGKVCRLKNAPPQDSSAILTISTTPGALYKLTFRWKQTKGWQAVVVIEDAQASRKQLSQSGLVFDRWEKETIYFEAASASSSVKVWILGRKSNEAQELFIKDVHLQPVLSDSSLTLSGGRVAGKKTGGGGTIELFGNDHPNNPGMVRIIGRLDVQDGDIKLKHARLMDDGHGLAVPDHVFENGYKLRPLEEVERFIKQSQHLEGIPKKNDDKGWSKLSLQDRDMKLLEKIEELTLYVIQQDKKIKELEKELKKPEKGRET
ncbi:MAG: hypothetical protein HY360_24905 [Verrucomicrobia bacterium]|nr:hypothetical protein [Verrucomicrobiota bacterium]